MSTTETTSTTTRGPGRYMRTALRDAAGALHLLAIDGDGRVATTGGDRDAWLCVLGTVRKAADGGWRFQTYAEPGEHPSHTGYADTMRGGMTRLLDLSDGGAAGLESPVQPAPDRGAVPEDVREAMVLAAPGRLTRTKRVAPASSLEAFTADVYDADDRARCGFDRIVATRVDGRVVVGMYDTFGPSLRVVRMETGDALREAADEDAALTRMEG